MTFRLRTATILTAALTLLPVAAATPAAATSSCFDTSRPVTVEEQRLDRTAPGGTEPVPAQVLRGTGLGHEVGVFTRVLCNLPDAQAARAVVRAHGEELWAAATARTRVAPPPGQLPATDDRGLYWARISMATALRQWTPGFELTDATRAELIRSFEYASRGITTSSFDDGVRRVLVTGFDPFTLDRDIRIGNPSGANALSLDGLRWTVNGQTVEIQTVVFPVRYTDFDEGMVEDALAPHYRPGAQHADLVMTASQGRAGLFDLEVFNGRRRSVSSIGDNNNLWGGGTLTAPVVSPGMPPGPEWLTTSLPTAAMAATPVAPFTTRVNTSVLEIPAGETQPVRRPGGPTPGSIAVEGAGGGYLSNEVAYRNTLQRELLDPAMPAGHLHVPVLFFDPANKTAVTDPSYEANRDTIVAGAHAILRNGLTALF
jgi:pyrrolidone-carboxylate peptidase